MASNPLNFKQLIDLALGTAESGQINVNALQCLLYNVVEKMNVLETEVDCSKYENLQLEKITTEAAKASEEAAPVEVVPVEATPEKPDAGNKVVEDTSPQEKPDLENRAIGSALVTEEPEEKNNEQFHKGIAIMKEQLELAMEQLLLVSSLAIENKPDNMKMEQLKSQINKLRSIQRENLYIASLNIAVEEPWSAWDAEGEKFEAECLSEQAMEAVSEETEPEQMIKPYEMDLHVSYAPEKILYQLMEVKADYCLLTNRFSGIEAVLSEIDNERTQLLLEELQKQINDINYNNSSMKDVIERNEAKQQKLNETLTQINEAIAELQEVKIDKETVEELLLEKANVKELEVKVSRDEMKKDVCCLERKICELHNLNDLMDKNVHRMIEELRISLGYNSIEEILASFKENIQNDFQSLQKLLNFYIQATNDECAAAGARVNVLPNLSCMSCDAACVMRKKERSRVGKLPNATPASNLAPLVTFKLSTIRKSGISGYYRQTKPPAEHQKVDLKTCVQRHAGGPHTVSNPKDRADKVLLNQNKF